MDDKYKREREIIDKALKPFEENRRVIEAGLENIVCMTCGRGASTCMQLNGACQCGCRKWMATG
jgi:hypothetical protein